MRVWGGGVGGRGGVERGEVEDAAQAAHPCVSFQALLRCGAFSLGAFWGGELAAAGRGERVPHIVSSASCHTARQLGACEGYARAYPQAYLRLTFGQRVGSVWA